MSEELKIVETAEPTVEDTKKPATAQEQQLAQVGQVVNNAIAALMDVGNLLRDIPKLVAVNAQLVAELQKLQGSTTGEEALRN